MEESDSSGTVQGSEAASGNLLRIKESRSEETDEKKGAGCAGCCPEYGQTLVCEEAVEALALQGICTALTVPPQIKEGLLTEPGQSNPEGRSVIRHVNQAQGQVMLKETAACNGNGLTET
ncbi:uncharacterized [Tachysurus ichikawai]